jgi:hypothetical protein
VDTEIEAPWSVDDQVRDGSPPVAVMDAFARRSGIAALVVTINLFLASRQFFRATRRR